MQRARAFLGRHRLWAAFLAAFVPLLVLVVLQYGWLVKLEHASAMAHRAGLYNLLEAVATEVKWFYGANAERALNLSPSIFTQNRCDKAALYFRKKGVEGAKRLFIVRLHGDEPADLLVYDPRSHTMDGSCAPAELRAISVAVAPWKTLSHKAAPLESVSLAVEDRDPANRMILLPITDERSQIVGVAGMIIDLEHFTRVVLPAAIERVLPCSEDAAAADNLVVTVRDGAGELVYATGKVAGGEDELTRPIPFPFAGWSLGLRTRYETPEQWARANFSLNLTLSILIALMLLGGILLALRTASREMRLSQMKSEFVSNVSHELRTPLSSIRVFAEFLRLGRVSAPEKVREYGEYIETESRRLTQLINNILDFAKIESGRKTYRLERADLGEVVADVLRTFQVRLSHTGFRIDLDAPAEGLPPVRMDAAAIAQAFHNLLDNAVKYSGDSREIHVRLRRDGGEVVVAVQDHGVGIAPSEQEKIFDRFHRVGNSLVHDVKGSGLGLSIVRHVVAAHGGRVVVESQPGHGSTFSIRLPVDGAAEPRGTVEAA